MTPAITVKRSPAEILSIIALKQRIPLGLFVVALLGTTPAMAQEETFATAADTAYIFISLLFLIGGFLVIWMTAGFAMLEAGFVRSKNVTMPLTRNIALFAIAALMFMLVAIILCIRPKMPG